MNIFLQFVVFGLFGVVADFIFTTLHDFSISKKWDFEAKKYLYMFPIYGLAAFVFVPAFKWLVDLGISLPLRLVIYVFGLYVIELVTGIILKKTIGRYVWYYEGKHQFAHLINFLYAPFWLLFVYMLEVVALRVSF